VVTGAASVGAKESSLTVGYEVGSGYVVEGFLDEALFALELETRLLFEPEALLVLVLEARLLFELEARLALELEARLALELEARLLSELETLFVLELEVRLPLELEVRLALELEVWLALEFEVRLALELEDRIPLELEDRIPLELEVLPAFTVEDRPVEDACVEDLAVLEKLAGSVIPLSLAHFWGSTPLGQHHPLTRQKVPDSHPEVVNCCLLNIGCM